MIQTDVVTLPPKEDLINHLKLGCFLPKETGIMEKIIDPIASFCGGSKMRLQEIENVVKSALFSQICVQNFDIARATFEIVALKISYSIFTSQSPLKSNL